MVSAILIMLAAALIIYFSCEFFVNGIEWVGKAFNISENAVGTILAAIGTALPESVITLIAVAFGASAKQKDIGVGSALGGPLVLSTIAYAIVGICFLTSRKKDKDGNRDAIKIDGKKLGRDQLWFMCIFVFKVALGFVAFAIKPWLGALFLIAYGVYCYIEMKAESEVASKNLEPLKFSPKTREPKKSVILLQTFVALIFIFVGSQLFVHNLDALSVALSLPPHIVALLLSPVATELPEVINAVIWVRQGKEKLALSNISGSMMIQATIPSALGIIFTPWMFDKTLALSAIITFVAIFSLWLTLKNKHLSAERLSLNGLLYIIFAIGVFFLTSH